MKPKLLISACLLGQKCRYDGGGNYVPAVERLRERYELIPVCPEQLGGLPTPRVPSERAGDRILTRTSADVTEAFRRGAARTLELARTHGVTQAVLKERSPSCGCGSIYDGSFTGTLVPGDGAAAELLKTDGIAVRGESRIEELL